MQQLFPHLLFSVLQSPAGHSQNQWQ